MHIMSDEELAAQLEACSTDDIEINHINADDLLIEQLRALGYTKSADAFEAIQKWYS